MKRVSTGRRRPDARHPDTNEMLSYLEARLEPKQRAAFELHLASPCFACQARLRDYGTLLGRMRTDRTPAVPETLHRIAIAAFESLPAAATPAPLAERIARLLLDTLGQPVPQAVRRSVGEVRRLRFDAGGIPVELECELESAARFALRGRVGAVDDGPHLVRVAVGDERFEARPDAAGLFALSGLPAGRAEVTVESPLGRWRLPAFELGTG